MSLFICAKQHIFAPNVFFQSCHASTLIQCSDGGIMAAWFAGTREGAEDVGIWAARRDDGIWQEPYCLVASPGVPCWNPVLHRSEAGRIFLFFKLGVSPEKWRTMVMFSPDDGRNWSRPRELPNDGIYSRGPVKNKILTIGERWLAPASTEENRVWDAYVDVSEDEGETWRRAPVPLDHGSLKGEGIIQPALWRSGERDVHMLLRSSEGCLFRSDSRDAGETWSAAVPVDLPNNNSGIDVARTASGILALVLNPIAQDWGIRTPLSLSLSTDNGMTWSQPHELDRNPDPIDREDGEFSYPAVIADGETLRLTYTWRRKTIEYMEIELY